MNMIKEISIWFRKKKDKIKTEVIIGRYNIYYCTSTCHIIIRLAIMSTVISYCKVVCYSVNIIRLDDICFSEEDKHTIRLFCRHQVSFTMFNTDNFQTKWFSQICYQLQCYCFFPQNIDYGMPSGSYNLSTLLPFCTQPLNDLSVHFHIARADVLGMFGLCVPLLKTQCSNNSVDCIMFHCVQYYFSTSQMELTQVKLLSE